jgi:YVTN family beta-propeller protein
VHWGNNVARYTDPEGRTLAVRHVGFDNDRRVLSWVYRRFRAPRQVFVTGCSAGSVGSAIFAPYVMRHYPRATVNQLGDSLAFVFSRPVDIERGWRADRNLPSWIPAMRTLDPTRMTMAEYYSIVANYYRRHTFGQFDYANDAVQTRYYVALGGNAEDFPGALAGSLAEIHQKAENFKSYIAPGTSHCALPLRAFYELATDGVPLARWVAQLVAGQSPSSVGGQRSLARGTSRDATIPVGSTPMSLAFGAGSVWSANRGDGTVSRIDPDTNRVTATIEVGGEPWGLAYGAGSIWVGNYKSSTVTRIDPGSNHVARRIPAGIQPIALEFGANALWVADYGAPRLLRIDPTTNGVTRAMRLPGAHLDVLDRRSGIWVASEEGSVVRVNPRLTRVTARIGGGADPTFITACRGSLWVTNFQGSQLWRIDERRASLRSRTAIGTGAAGTACSNGALWVAKYYESRALELAPPPRRARTAATGASPTDVLAAAGSIWIANSAAGSVTRLPLR